MSNGSVKEKNKQLEILLSQLMTKNVMEIKRLDQSIALEIAGFAGMPTRDARGNLLAQLWSKHTDNSDVGASTYCIRQKQCRAGALPRVLW